MELNRGEQVRALNMKQRSVHSLRGAVKKKPT